MDEELKQAFAALTALINGVAADVAALRGVINPTVPPQVDGPIMLPHIADLDWSQLTTLRDGNRYFNADFWVQGYPGAQKGVDLNLWGGAVTGMAMMGGFYTGDEHLYIVRLMNPQPDRGAWVNSLISAADLGWIPWTNFVPDDKETGGQAQLRWTQAGRPSVDADGYVVVGGKYTKDQKGNKLKKGDNSQFVVS